MSMELKTSPGLPRGGQRVASWHRLRSHDRHHYGDLHDHPFVRRNPPRFRFDRCHAVRILIRPPAGRHVAARAGGSHCGHLYCPPPRGALHVAWSATRGIALTCAAVDDVTAWCLLAFVSSIVYARVSGAIYTSMTPPGMAAVIVAALLSALSTE